MAQVHVPVPRLRQARGERHALRARAARSRATGRPGQGDRRAQGAADRRSAAARRLLLDAGGAFPRPARAVRAVRPGVPHLLARPEAARAGDGAPAAAGASDARPTSSRISRAASPRRCCRSRSPARTRRTPPEKIELDAAFTVSEREVLQRADFETMTKEELAQAKRLIASLRLPIPEVRTRRLVADPRGRLVDMRASLRASLRAGADIIPLKHRSSGRAPSAARRAVRHLRLDEPLLAHVPALPARDHQRPRPRAHLRLRHAAHQHHAPPAPSRRRRRARRASRRRSPTGRAARASARASRSSTCAGRGGCSGRTRSCC